MELSTQIGKQASEGARMTLHDPVTGLDLADAEGKSVVLILAGRDSEQYHKAEKIVNRRWQDERVRSRKVLVSPEQVTSGELDKAVACTLGWDNCEFGGNAAFSPELIRTMYQSEGWVLEQVQEFIADRANFSKGLATS